MIVDIADYKVTDALQTVTKRVMAIRLDAFTDAGTGPTSQAQQAWLDARLSEIRAIVLRAGGVADVNRSNLDRVWVYVLATSEGTRPGGGVQTKAEVNADLVERSAEIFSAAIDDLNATKERHRGYVKINTYGKGGDNA